VQNSSIHPSIHPSRCNTGSDTNKNRNAVPLLHIIQHIQCYIHMYKHTYTHTHTHTLYRMLTRSTSVKINQTVPLLSHNMMKLHQVCSCQAKKAWTSTTVVTYHHMREEIQKTLTLFTSGSHSALRRSRGIYYQFQEDLCLHFYNGCFEVYLFFKLKE
jgi:hypothetical protein